MREDPEEVAISLMVSEGFGAHEIEEGLNQVGGVLRSEQVFPGHKESSLRQMWVVYAVEEVSQMALLRLRNHVLVQRADFAQRRSMGI